MTITTVSGIAAVLLGVVYSYQAYTLPRASVGNPFGPIIFPLILGAGMAVLGVLLLVQERLRLKKAPGKTVKNVSLKFTEYGKSIAIVAALCAVYVFLFERLGYVLSTLFFLGSVLWLFNGKKKWKMVLIISVSFSFGVYILFGSVLSIQLPRMPIVGF